MGKKVDKDKFDEKDIMFYPQGFLNYLEMYPDERANYSKEIIDTAKALTAFADDDGEEKPSEVKVTFTNKFFDFLKEQGEGFIDMIKSCCSPQKKKEVRFQKEGDYTDVIQSMQITKVRYAFTTCEKNIFLKVVDVCQRFLDKKYLGENCTCKVQNFEKAGIVPVIEFPIKDILDENNTNYSWVKERLRDLHKKKFGLPGTKDWDFREASIFQRVMADKGSGMLGVILSVDFWDAFNNLECYKVINVNVAKKFKSIYAERIYEFLVGNKQDVIYEVKNLKLMFCLENKYKNNSLFVKYAIMPAQREMQELEECPFYFDYEIIYGSRRKIEKIKFKVIDKEKKSQADALQQYKLDFTEDTTLSDTVKDKIKECFGDNIDFNRSDVELRLKWAQRNLGVNELVEAIQSIKETAEDLKSKHKIKKSVAAFFLGSLDKYVEKHREEEKNKHIQKAPKKVKVQAPKDVDTWEENGYDYKTEANIRKLSKEFGRTFENYVKTFDFEEYQPGIWRHKKTK